MLAVHQRLAELYIISRGRLLTDSEQTELQQCLQVNAKYCWEMACLNNEAQLAVDTDDSQWQEEISSRMYEMRVTGKVKKRRK